MTELIMIGVSIMGGIVIGGITIAYIILKDIKDINDEVEELRRLCEKYKPYYLILKSKPYSISPNKNKKENGRADKTKLN